MWSSHPSRRSVRAALKPARPPPMMAYVFFLSLMMRGFVTFAGSKADLFMRSVAERFVPRSPTAAQIDRAVAVSLTTRVYPMTARPNNLYVSGNHIRSIQSRGNPNVHFLLLRARSNADTCARLLALHLLCNYFTKTYAA